MPTALITGGTTGIGRAFASDAAGYVTGQDAVVAGGYGLGA